MPSSTFYIPNGIEIENDEFSLYFYGAGFDIVEKTVYTPVSDNSFTKWKLYKHAETDPNKAYVIQYDLTIEEVLDALFAKNDKKNKMMFLLKQDR